MTDILDMENFLWLNNKNSNNNNNNNNSNNIACDGINSKEYGGASSSIGFDYSQQYCFGESCYKSKTPKSNHFSESNKKKYLVCHRCKKIANDQWYNGPLDGELICKGCFYKMYNHILEPQQQQQQQLQQKQLQQQQHQQQQQQQQQIVSTNNNNNYQFQHFSVSKLSGNY
ncbi:hypothetical protein PPL_04730 [Heterostelium album PN500]|uniref:Uncharacterized protein n=1 Tax=Heterostelium pallidum (strain ATCC 26659 / Pp 5 / PN500) TaxID=670386 RepID=D3B8D8_HETP5|nr:hypothetical protein PPL_04730 [Heterostelium album PN500]EFA82306.1 hypothetical protein PPL_04730 [Heterostelium album PN500]|eukprot:XP_020434423.1 hypothetical protein PPL_04730 [Heterostelium album PN500]